MIIVNLLDYFSNLLRLIAKAITPKKVTAIAPATIAVISTPLAIFLSTNLPAGLLFNPMKSVRELYLPTICEYLKKAS